MIKTNKKVTHFGSKTIHEDQKATLVRNLFDNVASKYDLMNDLMSAGIHRVWKSAMIDWLSPASGQHLLDVAGGTGDIAFRFLERLEYGNATVIDLTEAMLQEGIKRNPMNNSSLKIDWVVGDAMALPFKNNTFDVYTISFGIRNVTNIEVTLREAYRVLKPGGRIMILEFSKLPVPLIQKAYDLYSFNVIPKIGELVANDRDSYRYLVESIRKFPTQDVFSKMIEQVGFEKVKFRNLSLGVAALHSAWKI
tara:strand:- start:1692 stop:2444 length:753 start_codon:yes stop_codon:yes gene_type:complete